jgi:uncharacterized protein
MKKMVIAGANGFLGEALSSFFKDEFEIVGLVRKIPKVKSSVKYQLWDGISKGDWCQDLKDADVLINLVGRSVDCRYNSKNKKEILESRTKATQVLGEAIQSLENGPKLWINSASATIYRHAEDRRMTEVTGEFGTGFSVDVCQAWEACFNAFSLADCRKVLFRVGIVLSDDGGAFIPLKRLAKLGLGGKMGNGNQFVSWISVEDFCHGIRFAIENENLQGVYNLVSPSPIRNHDFMKELCEHYGCPLRIPTPKFLLEIGAFIIQTETELILKSRNVYPEKLLSDGFVFKYGKLGEWLNKKRPS